MELTKVQKRFINNKSMGFSLVKGKSLTGKTLTALYRVINLENNYCIYNDDKVLYVSASDEALVSNKALYEEKNKSNEYYSLFSLEEERTEFSTIKLLVKEFAEGYKRDNNIKLKLISLESAYSYIKSEEFYNELIRFSKKSKVLKKITEEYLYNEILWIKASNFDKDQYMNIDRKGRKNRLIKNSYTREAIYSLLELYNFILWENGFCDMYDETMFAIKYGQNMESKYTHVVLDEVERLTKGEIDFVKSIYKNNTYSSFVFVVNNESYYENNTWLVKGRKYKTLGAEFKGKSYFLKKEFKEEKNEKDIFMDNFKYINLKYKNVVDFKIDTASSNREIYLDDNTVYMENELEEVNVYNDIAAGNPIEINESVEDYFYLPKSFLGKGRDSFILHVKGDSMIEKDINDGDLVVIKKQNTACNNEIVAASLDGEATLKVLKLNGEAPVLAPANSRYSEIYLEGKEVSILGVAIGVIKKQ